MRKQHEKFQNFGSFNIVDKNLPNQLVFPERLGHHKRREFEKSSLWCYCYV